MVRLNDFMTLIVYPLMGAAELVQQVNDRFNNDNLGRTWL